MKTNWSLYLIVASIFIGVVGVTLLSDGMFFDGVIYANFSKVMARNVEGFWHLRECTNCEEVFGHPPFAIFLESLFFRLFGNTLYTERIFSFLTYIISGYFIHLIVKSHRPKKAFLSFITLLFWIITPLVTWGAANNMLENTMTILVLSATFLMFQSLKSYSNLNVFVAGVLIFLAFLTKGLVGTFPLIFFMLYWFIFKQISFQDALKKTTLLLISFLIPFILIFIFDNTGKVYLTNYFNNQIVNSIKNTVTVDSRFFILIKLFNELLPMLIISILVLFFNKKQFSFKSIFEKNKTFLFFGLYGLLGVVPMMVSLKQSGFYILSALPFFAIAFSFLIIDLLPNLKENQIDFIQKFKLKPISIVLFFISLVIMFGQVGKIGREKEMLHDIYAIEEFVNETDVISIPYTLAQDWALKAYFFRYAEIKLSPNPNVLQQYFLIEKNKNDAVLDHYKKVQSIELQKYDLYKTR